MSEPIDITIKFHSFSGVTIDQFKLEDGKLYWRSDTPYANGFSSWHELEADDNCEPIRAEWYAKMRWLLEHDINEDHSRPLRTKTILENSTTGSVDV